MTFQGEMLALWGLVLILLVITLWSCAAIRRLDAAETCQPHTHRVGVESGGSFSVESFGGTWQPVCS